MKTEAIIRCGVCAQTHATCHACYAPKAPFADLDEARRLYPERFRLGRARLQGVLALTEPKA